MTDVEETRFLYKAAADVIKLGVGIMAPAAHRHIPRSGTVLRNVVVARFEQMDPSDLLQYPHLCQFLTEIVLSSPSAMVQRWSDLAIAIWTVNGDYIWKSSFVSVGD